MCEIRHMAAIIIIKQNDEQSFGMFVVSSLLKKRENSQTKNKERNKYIQLAWEIPSCSIQKKSFDGLNSKPEK